MDITQLTLDVKNKVSYTLPDPTLYLETKGINLFNTPVVAPAPTRVRFPKLLTDTDSFLIDSWFLQHGALIEQSYKINNQLIYRSIFPGPFIPHLGGEMNNIGSFAYDVFMNTIKSVRERVPDLSKLIFKNGVYTYLSSYSPVYHDISFPTEGWDYLNIKQPKITGVSFPIPNDISKETVSHKRLKPVLDLIDNEMEIFLKEYSSSDKVAKIKSIKRTFSLIRAIESINNVDVSDVKSELILEILSNFKEEGFVVDKDNVKRVLFEIDHVASVLLKIYNKKYVLRGQFGMTWLDVFKLPVEDLMETELCEIPRVLREIRSYFSVGWSPIIVHIDSDKKTGFNIDGTHRHYALLVIELLRRLLISQNKSIRKIDINSKSTAKIIHEFSKEYRKEGLSLRETLRVLNYLVNSEIPWPFLSYLENNLMKLKDIKINWIPVVYLPEWRARTVVKSYCDEGVALIGVPPVNIEIVGRSGGTKGIYIRGGYHGTDRQPNLWINYFEAQKNEI